MLFELSCNIVSGILAILNIYLRNSPIMSEILICIRLSGVKFMLLRWKTERDEEMWSGSVVLRRRVQ